MQGPLGRKIKGYPPEEAVVSLMTNLLQYSSDLEYGRNVEKNRKRYLDKEKVTILDKFIFPSMANLTFFFKSISRYPELKHIFDDDIKDLLGVRRIDPQHNKYGFILSQLVRSILLIEEEEYSEEASAREDFPLHYQLAKIDKGDFRLRLNQILQDIIKIKIMDIDLAGVSEIEKRFLLDDFNRVLLWTRIIAAGTTQITEDTDDEDTENNKLPHRTIKFGRIPLREDEEPI
jgi:hypothetical protein